MYKKIENKIDSKADFFLNLPKRLIQENILKKLSLKDIVNFSMTSKNNKRIVESIMFDAKEISSETQNIKSTKMSYQKIVEQCQLRQSIYENYDSEKLGLFSCGVGAVSGLSGALMIVNGVGLCTCTKGCAICCITTGSIVSSLSAFSLFSACGFGICAINKYYNADKLKKIPEPLEMDYNGLPKDVTPNYIKLEEN